jgi:hypothetical protein
MCVTFFSFVAPSFCLFLSVHQLDDVITASNVQFYTAMAAFPGLPLVYGVTCDTPAAATACMYKQQKKLENSIIEN